MEYLNNVWDLLVELSFWLLLGCFVSGLMSVFISKSWLQKHLGGSSFGSVLKSVFIGVPMPLCSCGVIPAALGLKKHGAGNGASIGFLISTPQTGVDSIFVSASMLSWPFAIFKLVSAFVLGFIGGFFSCKIDSNSDVVESIVSEEVEESPKGIKAVYEFAVNELLYSIWKWIVFGVLVSAAITTWLPSDVVKDWTSYSLFLTLLAVLLVSLPLYVCATSSVPIAAALVDAGMPLSAALVFLMAGPATNIATIGAVYKGFGLKHLINYLTTIIVGSILLAYSFDFILADKVSMVMDHDHSVSYSVYLLLFFFAMFLAKDLRLLFRSSKFIESKDAGQSVKFEVGGLTCQGCVNKLSNELLSISDSKIKSVDRENGVVEMTLPAENQQKIQESVKKAGFTFKNFIN